MSWRALSGEDSEMAKTLLGWFLAPAPPGCGRVIEWCVDQGLSATHPAWTSDHISGPMALSISGLKARANDKCGRRSSGGI